MVDSFYVRVSTIGLTTIKTTGTDERTQVHSARSSLVVTHASIAEVDVSRTLGP